MLTEVWFGVMLIRSVNGQNNPVLYWEHVVDDLAVLEDE